MSKQYWEDYTWWEKIILVFIALKKTLPGLIPSKRTILNLFTFGTGLTIGAIISAIVIIFMVAVGDIAQVKEIPCTKQEKHHE